MSYQPSGMSRPGTLILSTILAGIIVAGFVPTPNAVGGGEAKMVLIIFLAVVFKAAIDFYFNKRQKKKDESHGQNHNSNDRTNS